jgi:hypothetical protein
MRRLPGCYGDLGLGSRRQYAAFFVLVAAVIAAVVLIGRAGRHGRAPRGVLAAVPKGAWLVATLDVAALRGSALAQPLVGSAGAAVLPGVGPLSSACGFDPLARLQQIAVAAPEAGDRGDFGVAFSSDLTRDELTRCAEKVIRARGGSPSTSSRGSFTVVEDAGDPKHTRLAYREGGPSLAGTGAWLDAMIDAVEAADKNADTASTEHDAVRDALAPSGAPARALVATALLPKALRDRLKAEIAPTAPNEAYAGVLSVDQAGLAVTTGGPGSTTELVAELRCETPAACDEVKKFLEKERFTLSRDLMVRMIGLGGLVDSFSAEAHGAALSLRARAPTEDVARAVQRIIDYQGGRSRAPAVRSIDAGL